jgi:hypothetical protein
MIQVEQKKIKRKVLLQGAKTPDLLSSLALEFVYALI